MKSPIIRVAALMLGCAALPSAAADQLLTRNRALAQSSSAGMKPRRAAVDRLSEVGLMSDARVLLRRLHDRDEATRALAIWPLGTPPHFPNRIGRVQSNAADESGHTGRVSRRLRQRALHLSFD